MKRDELDKLLADDIDKLLAAAIRRLRCERGWDQAEAAARFGRNRSTVCRWESGERPPPPPAQIARAFDVSIEEVVKPCPRCNYQPPLGYMCLSCRTEGKQNNE